MPVSTGYKNFVGTFVNFPADGTSQAITTGTAMSFPEAGTEVKALTAYRTVACTLANMAGAVRVDSKMHSFVQAIVAARETLELYREERSAADIATFEEAIATAEQQMTACLRCGRCATVCPMGLLPQPMAEAATAGDYERFEQRLYGLECIQCGSCTYVCPAKRPLMQTFKQAKSEIQARKRAEAGGKK
jgi:formate hydrogenlyase subunit 6/NADH:ubiquinone oxidoreductase subunit I